MPLTDRLPLAEGAGGEPVRDLQRRLASLGFDTAADADGVFGDGTAAALRAFQDRRGLRVDAVCGTQTWAALVEAGWKLGDRWLYLTHPMLRGDDVATLQRRLGGLGFDAGRVDGIFGPDTQHALEEFQRNAGLTVDGICGPDTLAALERLVRPDITEPIPVLAIREHEALRRDDRKLAGCRVVVGHGGGLDAVAHAAARVLSHHGAAASVAEHADGSVQAQLANAREAEIFVGLALLDPRRGPGCSSSYFKGVRWESAAGRLLAEAVTSAAAGALALPNLGTSGMSVPVLRETRMPATICEVTPATALVERSEHLARALPAALEGWLASA